ncbi:UNVERIFIED_CONTAM: hypothetical protein FKN15_061634 [Acipenser sinensis]
MINNKTINKKTIQLHKCAFRTCFSLQGGFNPLPAVSHIPPPPCLFKTPAIQRPPPSTLKRPPTLKSTNVNFRPLPRAGLRVGWSLRRFQGGTQDRRGGTQPACPGRPQRGPGARTDRQRRAPVDLRSNLWNLRWSAARCKGSGAISRGNTSDLCPLRSDLCLLRSDIWDSRRSGVRDQASDCAWQCCDLGARSSAGRSGHSGQVSTMTGLGPSLGNAGLNCTVGCSGSSGSTPSGSRDGSSTPSGSRDGSSTPSGSRDGSSHLCSSSSSSVGSRSCIINVATPSSCLCLSIFLICSS